MNTSTKLAFIGGGNMTGSIIGGLINSGWLAGNLFASDPATERREKLYKQFRITCFADNAECAEQGDAVVLAVKPQFLRQAVESIATVLQQQKPLLISIAAGIRCADVLRWAGGQLALVRVMPNTPALVNAGISGMFANELVDEARRKLAQSIMHAAGETLWVERETLLDTVTGVSGSGPAYFFKLMELITSSAVEHGLDQKTAESLALQTALGAAMLAKQSGQTPAALRYQVTSRGGTTEAALDKMADLGLDNTVRQGIAAAVKRSAQLADEFGAC